MNSMAHRRIQEQNAEKVIKILENISENMSENFKKLGKAAKQATKSTEEFVQVCENIIIKK